ncbi:MAG: hypothetical protein M3Y54_02620 [Bacteroidota bacterium]|nr:hypothetical protein [Bacteroidota bacterium]
MPYYMARNNELNLKKEAAIKAEAHQLLTVEKVRSQAVFERLGEKYFMKPASIASIYYGDYEKRRAKAAELKNSPVPVPT